jgi:beta-aspartyl-peptidase (threonine type)
MTKPVAIAIHGGAGTILKSLLSPELELEYVSALTTAVNKGYDVLSRGGSSLQAVEASVISLEDCPLFNAGRGAVFNSVGGHEMDAAIMEGAELRCGAISSVQRVKNPVSLAKMVMEKSEHVFLGGEGAVEFGKLHGIDFMDDDYFYVEHRYQQWLDIKDSDSYNLDHSLAPGEKKFGTVGAVALDIQGNLAAATSTGGMTNKKFGRIGDSPIIGAGTYANNNTCAISCTGHGELFIRSVVAYDISCLMEYKGYSLKQACDLVVYEKLVKIGGEGGLVAIDAKGNIELPFNSEGMYRASIDVDGHVKVSIYK